MTAGFSLIPIGFVFQNLSCAAMDGVLVLHSAGLELHFVLQYAVVHIPFHFQLGGLALTPAWLRAMDLAFSAPMSVEEAEAPPDWPEDWLLAVEPP